MPISIFSSLSWTSLAALAACAMAAAPAGRAEAAEGYLITSDYNHARMRVIDLADESVVYDMSLRSPTIHPKCVSEGNNCVPLGMHYVRHNDRDYLDVNLTIYRAVTGGGGGIMPTYATRLEMTQPPRKIWQIARLDFRGVDPSLHNCPQTAEESFGDPANFACMPQLAHAMDIVYDDPVAKIVRIVTADAFNARILQATLDYSHGSSTARVDWIVGLDHPDWPTFGLPNGIRYYERDGVEHLLVTWYMTGHIDGASDGAMGLFTRVGDEWEKSWQFPEESSGEYPFLQAPHMAQVLTDPLTGRDWLFYAHARGLSSDWGTDPNTDLGGSMGVLALGDSLEDPPTYIGEGVPYVDQALSDPIYRYARDIDFMDDGRVILSDSACENFCGGGAKHIIVDPFHAGLPASPLAGYFSADHSQQTLIDLSGAEVHQTLNCDVDGIFESHWVAPAEAGRHLRAASQSTTKLPCAAEPARTERR